MKYIIYNTYRHHIVSLLISILNYQNNQNNTKRGTHYSTQLHLRNKMAARKRQMTMTPSRLLMPIADWFIQDNGVANVKINEKFYR